MFPQKVNYGDHEPKDNYDDDDSDGDDDGDDNDSGSR